MNFTDVDAPLSHSRDGCMPIHNIQSAVCDKYKMILCSQTTAKANDRSNLKPMVEQIEAEYGVRPEIARADSDYFNIPDIQQLEALGTICYCNIPKNAEGRTGTDEHGQPILFTYDVQLDQYTCSQGKPLVRKGYETKGQRKAVRYQGTQCQDCPIREKCTRSTRARTIYRYDDEQWKEQYIRRMKSPNGRRQSALRRANVEHPFGTIKVTMMDRLQLKLRGTYKVHTEVCLYHFAYNFKRLVNIASFEHIRLMIRNFDFKTR